MVIKDRRPDALLLMGTHCPYCPTVLKELQSLVDEGVIGKVEAINIEEHPDTARELGVRSVPWVRLGPFELAGLRSKEELRQWAEKAASESGLSDWLVELLSTGELGKVEQLIAAEPATLDALMALFANPDTKLNTRIGISAIIEGLAGTGLLKTQMDRLAELVHHPDAGIRGDACHFLSLTGSPQAKNLIAPLLDDPETDVRMVAKDSLAHLEQSILH
jgi:thiol-disulfide isomerase/thioredoxin